MKSDIRTYKQLRTRQTAAFGLVLIIALSACLVPVAWAGDSPAKPKRSDKAAGDQKKRPSLVRISPIEAIDQVKDKEAQPAADPAETVSSLFRHVLKRAFEIIEQYVGGTPDSGSGSSLPHPDYRRDEGYGEAEGITFIRSAQNHSFRTKWNAGNILIISGLVRNTYPHERDFIRLRANLLGASGQILAESQVYAGNTLSENDLDNLSMEEIYALLMVKDGQKGRNRGIKPGHEIPFMVVFDRLPELMTEYQVDAIGSFPSDPGSAKRGDGRTEPPGLAPAKSITLKRVDQTHRIVENKKAGHIFIITGKAINSFDHRRAFIRLRAMLLGQNNNPLRERYVFAGNILSDEDLENLPLPEILTRLNVKGGQEGRNVNLEPGGEIPFMVVFDKLPEDMADYRVDVVGSSSAD